MFKHNVRTPEQALAYITDCILATVATMAMKKSSPKYEYGRQISIAQAAVDWMKQFGIDVSETRAKNVKTTVEEWAKQYEIWRIK